jgi:hypothetical protein
MMNFDAQSQKIMSRQSCTPGSQRSATMSMPDCSLSADIVAFAAAARMDAPSRQSRGGGRVGAAAARMDAPSRQSRGGGRVGAFASRYRARSAASHKERPGPP